MIVRLSLCSLFGLFSLYPLLAQEAESAQVMKKGRITDRQPDFTYQSTFYGRVEPVKANLSTRTQDPWQVQHEMVQYRDAEVNPQTPETIEEAARMEAKLAYRSALSNGISPASSSSGQMDLAPSSAAEAIQPLVGTSVQSTYNSGNSQVPDGAAAVNANGIIMVANNTHIEMFDADGNVLYSEPEATFFSALQPTANIYDPRIEYDTQHNRFVIIDLHGNNSTLTEIYLGVSETSDPTGAWNFYDITANPGDSNMWFDYPKLGLSEGTITVSGNMFFDTGNFAQESKVFLFTLDDAIAGNTISVEYFDDVEATYTVTDDAGNEVAASSNTYSIKPCTYPFGLYGPGLYMIGRFGEDNVAWFNVTENAGDGPTLDAYVVDLGDLNNPLNAPQSGGSNLQVAPRLQSAYVNVDGDQDKVHFAMTVSDDNGDDRIYLGRLNVSTENVVDRTFGQGGWDYAYPWIVPWTTNLASWDGGSMVAFLRVSSTTFPGFRVVHGYVNESFGNSVNVKSGETAMAAGSRWGDYIGGGWREGQSDPEVWVYGQYGLSNDHGLWLAQITENIEGCTNSGACNYDPDATVDDGSCEFTTCAGCTDAEACNFNANAEINDGSCTYPGCTNLAACNFSFQAGCDDGSCCYNTCINIEMPPGIFIPGLGINTMLYYSVTDNNSGEEVASGNNGGGTAQLCLESSCYTVDISGANVDWSVVRDPVFSFPGADLTIESGSGPANFSIILGDGGESAGCTDASACNYEPDALCDNGTCCYSSCVEISMTDSYGDGWNGNVWIVENAGDEVVTGTLELGYDGISIACLDPGCYQFSIDVSQGMYIYEIAWSLSGVEPEGLNGEWSDTAEFTVGDGGDDLGCTDNSACNFDANAVCDDGSCCFENCVDLIVTDSFGDGWNLATMTLTNDATGFTQDVTMTSGAIDTIGLCLESGCYDVVLTSGIYPAEVGWTLDYEGSGSFGGAPHEGCFTINVLFGCMDPSACNYDDQATCEDHSCVFPGCLDPMACNFNGCNTCEDNSLCDYGCSGCTYPSATNYTSSVTMDDGSCVFDSGPPASTCATDLDGNGQVGVADLLLVLGDFGNLCVPDPNDGE